MSTVRVLLVDDEPDIIEATLELLEGQIAHAEFLSASDGAQAMELIDQHAPHIVISDYRMPGATGLEVLAHAARAGASVTMMFTAFPDIEVAISAVQRGQVARFFTKPVEPDEFVAAVDEAVKGLRATAMRDAAFERANTLSESRR